MSEIPVLKIVDVSHMIDIELEGSLEDVICNLTDAKNLLEGRGYKELSILLDSGYNNIDIQISGEREETNEEKEKRLKIEKKAREKRKKEKLAKEKRALKEYERLKKKFGESQ